MALNSLFVYPSHVGSPTLCSPPTGGTIAVKSETNGGGKTHFVMKTVRSERKNITQCRLDKASVHSASPICLDKYGTNTGHKCLGCTCQWKGAGYTVVLGLHANSDNSHVPTRVRKLTSQRHSSSTPQARAAQQTDHSTSRMRSATSIAKCS